MDSGGSSGSSSNVAKQKNEEEERDVSKYEEVRVIRSTRLRLLPGDDSCDAVQRKSSSSSTSAGSSMYESRSNSHSSRYMSRTSHSSSGSSCCDGRWSSSSSRGNEEAETEDALCSRSSRRRGGSSSSSGRRGGSSSMSSDSEGFPQACRVGRDDAHSSSRSRSACRRILCAAAERQLEQQQERTVSSSSSRWRRLQQLRRRWQQRIRACQYRHEKAILLLIHSLLLILSATANPVLFKNMVDKLPNYGSFLSQSTTVAVTLVFILSASFTDYCGGISTEVKRYPKKKFALMGLLDSLSGILMIVGGLHTSGMLQVVLSQICILVSLAASVAILRKRYHMVHYVGACIILLGVLIVQWPSGDAASAGGGARVVNLLSYNILFALSSVPVGLSSVYKEVAFRGVEMDINYLQAWVGVFQFFTGFLVLPIQSLPALGPQAVPMEELPRSLREGFWCLLGYDSIVSDCGGSDEPPCDFCTGAWVPFGLYVAINVLFNLFNIVVLKLGGAALLSLIYTFRMPLSALAFSSPLIMGDRAVPVKITDICGLVVLLIGLGLYRLGSLRRKRALRRRLAAAVADVETAPMALVAETAARGSTCPFSGSSSSSSSSSVAFSSFSETQVAAAAAVAREGRLPSAAAALRSRFAADESADTREEEEEEGEFSEIETLPVVGVAPEPTQIHLRRPLVNPQEVLEAGGYAELSGDDTFLPFSVKVTSPAGDQSLRAVQQQEGRTLLPR